MHFIPFPCSSVPIGIEMEGILGRSFVPIQRRENLKK
jgi:hypothetical protein